MNIRFIFIFCIFVSLCVGPWWLSMSLIFLGCIVFEFFWIGIVCAGLVDLVYGHFNTLEDLAHSYTIITLILFLIVFVLRPRIRLYGNS